MKIAMVSEHASPLAPLGSVDAGGQNVHLAAPAAAVRRMGHNVIVYPRRDDPSMPSRLRLDSGFSVVHVDAGPPRPIPKDDLWPHMGQFVDGLNAAWRRNRPDV